MELFGSAGQSKTQITMKTAKKQGLKVKRVRITRLKKADLLGLPQLSKKDDRKITREAKKVRDNDLYYALKHVGDDPVKSEIQSVLREMLDDETFRRVVAVFKIATRTR